LSASPFLWVTKKRIRELLSIAAVLDYLHYKQESPRMYRERSAFLCSEVEIVQISAILEKQKRFISICYLISCISLFSFLFGLMKAKIGKNINKKEKNVILYG